MAAAPFYLISFAVEPHQYNERLDALISLYSKLIVYQRILQSNFSGDEKEVVLAALAKYSPERGQTEVARKLPQLLALISEWSMNDINFNPTMKNIISNDMLEVCFQVFEALLKSMSGSGQKGPPLVLLLNSGQFAGKNPLKILSQLTKALKLTLIVEYSTEYAEFKSAVGPEELVAMFKDERVSSENLSIGNLSLEEGKKLCNQYCSYMFGLDIPMNPDLSQYLALKGKTNPSGILSLVRLFLDKGFIEFELSSKRLDVSEKFIQTGDESWGETYLLAPMAFIRQNCYLLNELTPVDSCVPSADPGPEHGGDPRRDIRRHTDQQHQLFPSARDGLDKKVAGKAVSARNHRIARPAGRVPALQVRAPDRPVPDLREDALPAQENHPQAVPRVLQDPPGPRLHLLRDADRSAIDRRRELPLLPLSKQQPAKERFEVPRCSRASPRNSSSTSSRPESFTRSTSTNIRRTPKPS